MTNFQLKENKPNIERKDKQFIYLSDIMLGLIDGIISVLKADTGK